MMSKKPVRTPPHSVDAEEYLISCCLLDGAPSVSKAIEKRVSSKTFYFAANQAIWAKIVELFSEGKPVELSTLAQELSVSKQLDVVGGYAYLTQVSQRIPTSAQASYFAEKIVELAELRDALALASSIAESCYEYSGGGLSSAIGSQITQLLSVVAGGSSEAEPSWDELIQEAQKIQVAYCADGGRPKEAVINFPFPEMDEAFEPMQRGQLVILGAAASTGKSSLLRQCAAAAANDGKRVYFVTLEVNPVQVVLQLAATASRVSVRALGRCSPSSAESFGEALKGLKRLGIVISKRDRSLAQILGKAKALHATKPLDMICVDYGGLIEDIANSTKEEKTASIGRVLKALKRLAVDLNCVVCVPWQLNRTSFHENREPRLYDLRDSGDVEQDADKVIFIHRPSENPLTKQPQDNTSAKNVTPLFYCDLIQAKGRDDGAGRIGIHFSRAIASFEPITMPPKTEAWQGRF